MMATINKHVCISERFNMVSYLIKVFDTPLDILSKLVLGEY